jgi:hypothetical protein
VHHPVAAEGPPQVVQVPCVTTISPLRQLIDPARYRFTFVPGVTTRACSPRFIHMQPMSGFRFRSTSSWKTAASSSGRPLSNSRIFRSFQARRGSVLPGTGRGRRHTIACACRRRRTVSSLSLTRCTSYNTTASVAQHQRLRQ